MRPRPTAEVERAIADVGAVGGETRSSTNQKLEMHRDRDAMNSP
jgi:hypothetical protein